MTKNLDMKYVANGVDIKDKDIETKLARNLTFWDTNNEMRFYRLSDIHARSIYNNIVVNDFFPAADTSDIIFDCHLYDWDIVYDNFFKRFQDLFKHDLKRINYSVSGKEAMYLKYCYPYTLAQVFIDANLRIMRTWRNTAQFLINLATSETVWKSRYVKDGAISRDKQITTLDYRIDDNRRVQVNFADDGMLASAYAVETSRQPFPAGLLMSDIYNPLVQTDKKDIYERSIVCPKVLHHGIIEKFIPENTK